MSRRESIAIMVLIIVAVAYFGGHVVAAGMRGNLSVQSPTGTTRPLQEDDPGWNCRTMGNRICGPTTSQRGG